MSHSELSAIMSRLELGRCRYFRSVSVFGIFSVFLKSVSVSVSVFFSRPLQRIFTATCFSNVAVMGSLDVRPSVRPSVCP